VAARRAPELGVETELVVGGSGGFPGPEAVVGAVRSLSA
jgi:hypothetical protein